MPSRPLTKTENRLYLGSALIILLAAGTGLFFHAVNREPDWNFPDLPPDPNPNGYDVYLKANTLLSPGTPPVDAKLDRVTLSPAQAAQRYSLSRRLQWLKASAAGFALIEQAQHLPVDKPNALSLPSSPGKGAIFRQLGRYKGVQAKTYFETKEYHRSFTAGLDNVQMGQDFSRTGDVVDLSIDVSIGNLALRPLELSLPHLTAPQALSHAGRLQKLLNTATTFQQVRERDKWNSLWFVRAAMHNGNWRPYFLLTEPTFIQKLDLRLKPRRALHAEFVAWLDYYAKLAGLPYKATLPPPDNNPDIVVKNLVLRELFDSEQIEYLRNRAYLRMLLIRLHLQAIKQQTDHFPKNIEEIPGLTAKELTDPFSPTNQHLHYRPQADSYLLWSIGPDAIDNNANPAPDSEPGFRRVYKDSKGDLVTPFPPSALLLNPPTRKITNPNPPPT